MMYVFIQLIYLISFMVYSSDQKDFKVTVNRIVELDFLPSASGVEIIKDSIFIIGDDSPFLFQLSGEYHLEEKFPLISNQTHLHRVEKVDKIDLECTAVGQVNQQNFLFAFGSGSKSPIRDSLFAVNLNGSFTVQEYSLQPLYDRITNEKYTGREMMNIEGAVILDNHLYLLNRGNNDIIRIGWPAFVRYLQGHEKVEDLVLDYYHFALPMIKGVEAGFSGACEVPGKSAILFTASVEDTQDWIADGEVLGSFVGMIDMDDLMRQKVKLYAPIISADHFIVLDKVESIAFKSLDAQGNIKVLTVVDNDTGSSRIIELTIQCRNKEK